MSEDDALRIARQVVGEDEGALAARMMHEEGRPVWHVAARVIGAAPFVRIDGLTGAVLESGRYGLR